MEKTERNKGGIGKEEILCSRLPSPVVGCPQSHRLTVNNTKSSGALTPLVCVQASEIRITFFINKQVGRMFIIIYAEHTLLKHGGSKREEELRRAKDSRDLPLGEQLVGRARSSTFLGQEVNPQLSRV